jgi:ferredoxin--NADP+ reductase
MSTTAAQGPTLREAKMHLATPAAPVVGRVVSSQRCTASSKAAGYVRHVAIDISNTPIAGNFIAGQSFGVLPPGLDANNKPLKLRLYSIASPSFGEDGKGNVLATTVKRTIDEHWDTHKLFLGVCSNYLCDLHEGDEVKITGPSGKRFVLPQNPLDHEFVFVATGTGIAPFRGMILELLRNPSPPKITLLMGSPYASDLLYHQQLEELAASSKANFRYVTALSREPQKDGKPAMYVHQRFAQNDEALSASLHNPNTLIYICGIAGMELGVFQQLAQSLAPTALERFVQVDSATLADVKNWQRTMLHKQIGITRNVFLEVY